MKKKELEEALRTAKSAFDAVMTAYNGVVHQLARAQTVNAERVMRDPVVVAPEPDDTDVSDAARNRAIRRAARRALAVMKREQDTRYDRSSEASCDYEAETDDVIEALDKALREKL